MSHSDVRCHIIDRVAFAYGVPSSLSDQAVFGEFSFEAFSLSTIFQLASFLNNLSQDVTIGPWLRTVTSFS